MSGYVISEIALDVAGKSNRYGTVRAKQGDNLTRKIHARITNNGVDYPIASGSSVMVNFHRYDSKTRSYDCTLEDDGTITFPLPYWVLELPYMVTCDVAIIERFQDGTTRKLTTFNFYINVEAASVSDNDEQADEEASFLLRLIQETQDLADDFRGHYVSNTTSAYPDITIANRTHYCYSKPTGITGCTISIPAAAEQGWVADVAFKTGNAGVNILFNNNSSLSLRIIQFSAELAVAPSGGSCQFGVGSDKIIHLFVSVDGLIVQCVVEELEG